MRPTTLPQTPALAGYTWRPATSGDAEAVFRLFTACGEFDRPGYAFSREDVRRQLENPGVDFATDSLLALTGTGEVAAAGWVFSPPGETESQAYLRGEIHPDYRRQGLGRFLLEWTETRGRQILAQRPAERPRILRLSCAEHNEDRQHLYARFGYTPIRYAFRMRRDLGDPIPPVELPPSFEIIPWDMAYDLEALEACNEAFRDHWGYIPIPPEVWRLYYTGDPDFCPEQSFLVLTAQDEAGRRQVAGFSINKVSEAENASSGFNEGWITELGVRRAYRKQGLASAMLCASMQAFKDKGQDYAALSVDAENLTGALRIYERQGFRRVLTQVTYQKPYSDVV